MVHSPDFFPKNSQTFFIKRKAFFGRALVEKLVDGMCSLLPYGTESWYLPLCIICKKNKMFLSISVIHFSQSLSLSFSLSLSLSLSR